MRKLAISTLAAIVGLSATAALAEYPDRPITVINPYSVGGGTDVGIRSWQPFVEQCLGGATLVPTSMPGAAAAVGIAALHAAVPDGYTIGMANMPNLVSNHLSRPENPSFEEFVFLGSIIGVRSTINVRNDSPYKSWADAEAFFRASSTPVNVGIGGIGADDHLAGLQIERELGIDLNFIPFGGGADSRNALLGGQVEFAMMSNSESALFKDEIRPLAIAGDERSKLFPDVPTLTEVGVPVVGGSDHVITAHKDFPADALAKWRDCIVKVAADPAFLAVAVERSLSLNPMNAEQTEAFVRDQATKLGQLWATNPWITP